MRDPLDTTMDGIEAREFRIAAVYQYLLLACTFFVTLIALQIWASVFDPQQSANLDRKDWLIPVFFSAFAGILVFLSIAAFRWRLRVDSKGIHRRRLRHWDLWPWTAFQSGQVYVAAFPLAYWFPAKPRWQRGLALEHLNRATGDWVRETIEQFWVPPPSPEVPDELKIVYPKNFKFSPVPEEIHFDAGGIGVRRKNRQESYRWDEVKSLDLRRVHHDQPDFDVLKLRMRDRTVRLGVELKLGNRTYNWVGPAPEQVAGVLLKYTPPDRVKETARRGPPKNMDEYVRRLRGARRFRWGVLIASVFFAALSTFPLRRVVDHAFQSVFQSGLPPWMQLEMALTWGRSLFAMVGFFLLMIGYPAFYLYKWCDAEFRVLARWRARTAEVTHEPL